MSSGPPLGTAVLDIDGSVLSSTGQIGDVSTIVAILQDTALLLSAGAAKGAEPEPLKRLSVVVGERQYVACLADNKIHVAVRNTSA
eukprot:m.79744 g.79744  ORF g.79744 m.79744 type:complete len:86 (-) comp14636_c0_seq2:31-288(-)